MPFGAIRAHEDLPRNVRPNIRPGGPPGAPLWCRSVMVGDSRARGLLAAAVTAPEGTRTVVDARLDGGPGRLLGGAAVDVHEIGGGAIHDLPRPTTGDQVRSRMSRTISSTPPSPIPGVRYEPPP